MLSISLGLFQAVSGPVFEQLLKATTPFGQQDGAYQLLGALLGHTASSVLSHVVDTQDELVAGQRAIQHDLATQEQALKVLRKKLDAMATADLFAAVKRLTRLPKLDNLTAQDKALLSAQLQDTILLLDSSEVLASSGLFEAIIVEEVRLLRALAAQMLGAHAHAALYRDEILQVLLRQSNLLEGDCKRLEEQRANALEKLPAATSAAKSARERIRDLTVEFDPGPSLPRPRIKKTWRPTDVDMFVLEADLAALQEARDRETAIARYKVYRQAVDPVEALEERQANLEAQANCLPEIDNLKGHLAQLSDLIRFVSRFGG